MALIAVAAVILLTVLLRGGGSGDSKTADEPKTAETGNEETDMDLDIPIDSTPMSSGSVSAPSEGEDPPAEPTVEPTPNIDPVTGIELDEDELPIIAP